METCGVIAEGKIRQTRNASPTPETNFEFLLSDLDAVDATWHTHPTTSANLSVDDWYFFQTWPGLLHFIVSSSEVRCYTVIDGEVYGIDEEADHPAWVPEGPVPPSD